MIGFQVFEIGNDGVSHPISKVYSTWLGCKRVLNRIKKENCDLFGYCYFIKEV